MSQKQVMLKSEDLSRSLEINAIWTFDTEFPNIFNKSCTRLCLYTVAGWGVMFCVYTVAGWGVMFCVCILWRVGCHVLCLYCGGLGCLVLCLYTVTGWGVMLGVYTVAGWGVLFCVCILWRGRMSCSVSV